MTDYIFVGAGPSALSAAWYLAKAGKTCLLIERQPSIGGCHRVVREDGYFTEHGPRIYSTAYVNFKALLQEMGLNFSTLFTPYHFNIARIGGATLQSALSWREVAVIAGAYVWGIFNSTYGTLTTMSTFMTKHAFSLEAQDYIDRLCRLSDGAGKDRYTLYEFLQLVNQEGLYSLQQPVLPNDVGLFSEWEKVLRATGKVEILVNAEVLEIRESTSIQSLLIQHAGKRREVTAHRYVLAMPPTSIVSLATQVEPKLGRNVSRVQQWFGPGFTQWALAHQYLDYVSLTYHWKEKLDLPEVWGFSSSEWGLVFVVLSDYMRFEDCKTVISVALTTYTGNAPPAQLLQEAFRQLKQSYPMLPSPDKSLINPNNYRCQGRWTDVDSGYVRTPYLFPSSGAGSSSGASMFVPFQSRIQNLYNLGTQNGYSDYAFTSMESAISNSVTFVNQVDNQDIQVQRGWKLNTLLQLFFGLLLYFLLFRKSVFAKG